MVRELETRIADCRTNAVPALSNRRVGKPHHGEVGKPEGDVHFDVNRIRLDAEDRRTPQARKHDAMETARNESRLSR